MNKQLVYDEDIFLKINELISNNQFELIFVLCDKNTEKHCLPILKSQLNSNIEIHNFSIEAGERSKNIRNAELIWRKLIEIRNSRKILLINLGGGMVSDIGGFVAATFMRGIDFINVPTSLLAMVDASIGGKTGINLDDTKNIIGAYAFPMATFIHADFLKTLEKREFLSGLAEMLKHGLIHNKKHWKNICSIQQINLESIKDLIIDSTKIKIEIVERDPNDQGIRKTLNFGHTIGHAIESEFMNSENYLLHGEAIAVGMLIESLLSYHKNMLNEMEVDGIFRNILKIFPKVRIPENAISPLIDKMKLDKKNQKSQINFSLINGLGQSTFDVFIDKNSIHQTILEYNRKLEQY